MCVFGQPAMSRDFEKIRSLSGIGHQNASEQIAGMGGDIFREGERGRNNVFVQQVDVITVWVRRVIVKGQVTGEHGVLFKIEPLAACTSEVKGENGSPI